MGLVRFVTTTGAGYSGITSKDKDTLYFISDERRIYKGEVPYSGGIFTTVAEFPETGEVNTLYVNSATGEVRYYNGTSYQTVVPATGKSITGKGDGSLATTAAVAAYVTSQIGDLNGSVLKGRVDTLEGEMDTTQGQIATINGEGDGSIKKAASDAVASAKSYTDTVAAGKANTAHTHKMADVTGLSDALAGKANTKHTHTIADVTDLQTALNGKADATAIAAEKTRAEGAEQANATAIANEVTRAKSAEETNASAIEQYRQEVTSYLTQLGVAMNVYPSMQAAQSANLPSGRSFMLTSFNANDGYIGLYTVTSKNNSKCIPYNIDTYAQVEAINGIVRPENFFGSFANTEDDTNLQYVLDSGYTNFFLEGTYKIHSALSLPDNVNFMGANTNLRTSTNTVFQMMNSTAQIVLPATSVIHGIRFEYPNRVYNDTTYAASIYIANNDAKTNIYDIAFINGNIGIDMNNVNQVNIDGVYGWCSKTMIHTYNRWEHSVINDVCMTPWALSELISADTINAYDLFYYSYLNSTVLDIDTRTDWLSCSNIFGYSVKTVLRTNITGGDFENIGADGCNLPIWIQRSNNSTTELSINNLMLTCVLSGKLNGKIKYQDNPLILIDNETSFNVPDIKINISNVSVWGSPYEFLRMNRSFAYVNLSNVNIIKGTTQSFTDKPGTDPLIFINSYSGNNINVSNVTINANAMDYLISGHSDINHLTINGLYANLSEQTNQPHLMPSGYFINDGAFFGVRLVYTGYTPEEAYDYMNAPTTGRYIGQIIISGISISKINATFGNNVTAYLLLNNTLYNKNIYTTNAQ